MKVYTKMKDCREQYSGGNFVIVDSNLKNTKTIESNYNDLKISYS